MGRKKTRRSQIRTKIKTKIPSSFDCPECNIEGAVRISIVKKKRANAICSVCSASYSTDADKLTARVDVYAKWIDEKNIKNNF